MNYEIKIPRPGRDAATLAIESEHSIIIVGANGAGKTRLGAYVEANIAPKPVLRISAQKSLRLSDVVQPTSLERAEKALRFGYEGGSEAHRVGHRWGNNPAVHPLDDFTPLLQCLFAEHTRTAITYFEQAEQERGALVPMTRLRKLKGIWEDLLPLQVLKIREATIEVMQKSAIDERTYAGSDMSDGERAIFYFLGQCLIAQNDSVIIIDEPEGHIHKAILGSLWDAIEKARPDCGFLYITHDLEFATTRSATAKYFIRSYTHNPQTWDIEELPHDVGLPDIVVADIVGSRKPILFVEGENGSLDLMLYRQCYPDFTIIPIGGCDAVIHSVSSYKNSSSLHWLEVRGLVDADHRSNEMIAELKAKDVYVIPVAEVESLLLLPDVFAALAECSGKDPSESLTRLVDKVMQTAAQHVDNVSVRYTGRRLDERLKLVARAATDLATLRNHYQNELSCIDPTVMFLAFKKEFEAAIGKRDLEQVLKLFDNKTLLSLATGVLGLRDNAQSLKDRVQRWLGSSEKDGAKLRAALAKYLPEIPGPTRDRQELLA